MLARHRQQGPLVRLRENVLANMLADIAEDDAAVLLAAGRAKEIVSPEHALELLDMPDDQLQAMGWTRVGLHIALDAKRSTRESSYYLRIAHERSLLRWRGTDGERPSMEATIVSPAPPAQQIEAEPVAPPEIGPPEGGDDEGSR
jgi:hypothetical protein